MALKKQKSNSYGALLRCFIGANKANELIGLNDEMKKKALFKLPYHSGMSKAILAIDFDSNAEGEYLYQIEQKRGVLFQVEHMVPLKLDQPYSAYGYDEFSVNEFWNLNLLEARLNRKICE